jgi:hypothetical protein
MRFGEDSYENNFFDDYAVRGGLSYAPQPFVPQYREPLPFVPQYREPLPFVPQYREYEQTYYEPQYFEPQPFVPQYREPEPQYFEPPPFVPQYREPEPQYFEPQPFVPQYREPEPQPFVPQYREPEPAPSYSEPEPTMQVSANFASTPEPTGGLSAAADPAPYSPPALTPEFLQQLQQGAALAGSSPLFNAAGGLSTLQPGTLNPLDPLYDYAKTAPILSLKGDDEFENLNFQPLPDTNYQLTVGGNVVGTASNPQEVAALVDQANAISEQGGKTVDVRLQKEVQAATPTGEAYTAFDDVYANQPNNNGFLDTALPAALALMGGVGLPQLLGGGFLAAGLGAGLGSIAGSLGTGASLENALIKGGISGLTAGALSGLSAAAPVVGAKVGSAAGSAAGAGAAGAGAAGAFTPLANEILVQTTRPLLSSALSGGIGGGLGSIGSSLVQPDPFKQALDQARLDNEFGLGDTVVTGARVPTTVSPLDSVSPAAPAAIQYIADPSEVAGQIATPEEPEIVVSNTASPRADLSGLASLVPTVGGASPAPVTTLPTTSEILGYGLEGPEVTVETGRLTPGTINDALAAVASSGAEIGPGVSVYTPPPSAETLQTNAANTPEAPEMVVTSTPTGASGSLGAVLPGLATTLPAMTAESAVTGGAPAKDSILSKIDPVRLGVSGLLGLVSALSSGGGGGRGVATGNAGAGTRASLDPIFSAKLPAASPQYSGTSLAPRDMRGVDFARYGYGPAASFFENVPRNPEEYKAALAANAPTARPSGALNLPPVTLPTGGAAADPTVTATNLIRTYIPSATDAEITEFLGTEEGMQFLTRFGGAPIGRARGGAMRGKGTSRESYAVKGAGTGRSDEIPALLSDGEYVIDAETVAMLGDGSSEAGAKRLDDFRVKIRKHKGRNLAKGKFSANAKRPEKYLAGGRA